MFYWKTAMFICVRVIHSCLLTHPQDGVAVTATVMVHRPETIHYLALQENWRFIGRWSMRMEGGAVPALPSQASKPPCPQLSPMSSLVCGQLFFLTNIFQSLPMILYVCSWPVKASSTRVSLDPTFSPWLPLQAPNGSEEAIALLRSF